MTVKSRQKTFQILEQIRFWTQIYSFFKAIINGNNGYVENNMK